MAQRGKSLATTGIVLAYLGLVVWPLSIVGAALGFIARRQSQGQHGLHAVVAGVTIGAISAFCVGSLVLRALMGV